MSELKELKEQVEHERLWKLAAQEQLYKLQGDYAKLYTINTELLKQIEDVKNKSLIILKTKSLQNRSLKV